jgi:hypothetical protein
MLYARTSIEYWYDILFVEGFLHGERFFLNPLALASRYTDGARDEGNPHTWPVTESEIREMLGDGVTELKLRRLGTELDYYLPLMLRLPKLNSWLPAAFRKPLARRWGWSIWFQATKRA